ncbi:MAG: hypothetical protein ACRC8Q_05300 [Aeromonas sp.]
MKEKLTPRKVFHLALVLALLVSLVVFRTWFVTPDGTTHAQNEPLLICDLARTPCHALLEGQPLTVAIDNLPARAEHPLHITLMGGDPAVTPIKVWLDGKEMSMGTILLNLNPIAGGWQGSAAVGRCHSASMVWQLNIQWSNGQLQQWPISIPRT